jgi:hypothetical protein
MYSVTRPDPERTDIDSIHTTYVFTERGHPAHPAVVIFNSYLGGSTHYGVRESYFAGNESEFKSWAGRFRSTEFSLIIPE